MINLGELRIYKLSEEVGKDVYRILKNFPAEEKYCMVPQIRRAAVSIGANIAEGAGRNTKADLNRFLSIAMGSLNELSFYMRMSRETEMISGETHEDISKKLMILGKMINRFIGNYKKSTNLPTCQFTN